MPTGLEFGSCVMLGAFVVLGWVVLRRPGVGPMPFWMAGWIAAGASGVLVLAASDSPRLQFLTRAGFAVIATRGGREGIERLRDEGASIDAVVLDLSMPDVGGEQAFLEMRPIRPDLPIVLASGFSEEFASERFRAPATAGFLRKPDAPEALVEYVRAALGGPSS